MRCYSHLSDDEREQIGLAKALGHSIGAIAQAIGRPKSTISRELSRNKLPSGRYSPLHAAGAYQLRRRREALIAPYEPSLSTASRRGGPQSKFPAG
jgi:IS30 family transposase